jgi:threonyl-tRNA synthetase
MPDRFNLTYIDSDGTEKRSVVVHRSSIGAIERVIAFLIEHYAGAFPTWLAPVQVKVLPIGEGHRTYAEEVAKKLRLQNIRAEIDASDESLGKRIRKAKTEKLPYLVVVGDKEVADQTVSLEERSVGSLGAQTLEQCITTITEAIASKK